MTYRSFLLALSFSALAAAAHATDYHYTTIDTPGADTTFVLDINNAGQWAGYAVNVIPGAPGGGIYTGITSGPTGSGMSTFGRPGTAGIGASGINSSGMISGVSVSPTFVANGFVRSADGSAYQDIDPGAHGITSAYSEAVDLNDDGMFVGFYNETVPTSDAEASINSHGFIVKNGVYSTFDAPVAGAFGTQIYSVNNAGTVSGRYLTADGASHGFLYDTGTSAFEEISIPGFDSTEGGGLNSHGDYTAVAYVPFAGSPTGVLPLSFIHSGGAYTPFSVPGALATLAYSLNDGGQVVGAYVTAGAEGLEYHGFVATPVPEPSTLAALGLGAFALLRRRRHS